MLGPRVTVQETDGDRFDAFLLEVVHDALEGCEVGGDRRISGKIDAFAHLSPQVARHERRRLVDADVVIVGLALAPDVQHVAEAGSGDEAGPRDAAGDHRVGGDGGAMPEISDFSRLDFRAFEQRLDAFGNGSRRIAGSRGRLVEEGAAVGKPDEGDVGEGAADVDSERVGLSHR